MAYWIIKSDPDSYTWDQMKKDGSTNWDGVRNYQARNNINLMQVGDVAFFYESNEGKSVVGMVKIKSTAFPDPTADDTKWTCVVVEYHSDLPKPVSLAQMKADDVLSQIGLVKQSRLSVIPISDNEYNRIIELAN